MVKWLLSMPSKHRIVLSKGLEVGVGADAVARHLPPLRLLGRLRGGISQEPDRAHVLASTPPFR